MISIARRLKRICFARGEEIFRKGEVAQTLYIVQAGMVGSNGRVLRSGQHTGDEMVLSGARRSCNANAMTFADMQTLHHNHLYAILDAGNFPATARLIKTAALRLSLRRHLRKLVREIKVIKMISGGGRMSRAEMRAWKADMAAKKDDARERKTVQLADELADSAGTLNIAIRDSTSPRARHEFCVKFGCRRRGGDAAALLCALAEGCRQCSSLLLLCQVCPQRIGSSSCGTMARRSAANS